MSIVLTLLFSAAHADIPPPADRRIQVHEVVFQGSEAFPEWSLMVFPYSTSRGAPDAEAVIVRPGVALPFAGRIRGAPAVYAVRTADAPTVSAAITAASREGGSVDVLAGHPLVPCGLTIVPRTTQVTLDQPPTVVDTYAVTALSEAGCTLVPAEAPAPAPAPTPPPEPEHGTHGASGCDTAAGGSAWLGLLALLGLRRQRARVG